MCPTGKKSYESYYRFFLFKTRFWKDENAMLPAGYRQRDQTKKSPTGPFDRFALMDYLEKEAMEHKDSDDLVPFTGEKRGKAFVPKPGTGQIPAEEQITLEPELEEALKNATDAEMCDIAGGHPISTQFLLILFT
uniref:Tropomodulin 4 (muscle) n=1 Tax=Sinocyclocheilus grahami TaxID=75366 RepID=A0A672RP50_SINGR